MSDIEDIRLLESIKELINDSVLVDTGGHYNNVDGEGEFGIYRDHIGNHYIIWFVDGVAVTEGFSKVKKYVATNVITGGMYKWEIA